MPDTVKVTYNLDIESTDKMCSIVNNVGRALVEKKVLMLRSKEIDAINNSDIYETLWYIRIFTLVKKKAWRKSCFKLYSQPMV